MNFEAYATYMTSSLDDFFPDHDCPQLFSCFPEAILPDYRRIVIKVPDMNQYILNVLDAKKIEHTLTIFGKLINDPPVLVQITRSGEQFSYLTSVDPLNALGLGSLFNAKVKIADRDDFLKNPSLYHYYGRNFYQLFNLSTDLQWQDIQYFHHKFPFI